MNGTSYYNYIEEKLNILAYGIATRGKLNMLDLHTHSENFYLRFFNILYDYNMDNLNEYLQNVEAIDLIDHTNKIVIQVSATNTKLFSDEFKATLKLQANKFNNHFAYISKELYKEKYALKYDKATKKNGEKLYKFSAFNANFGSGKKQGEASCFDIAYTFFADEENIPRMHFLLNDKKELMYGGQLDKIAELVNRKNIQFITSILRDKLTNKLDNEDYFILKLSDHDKLFKIENG